MIVGKGMIARAFHTYNDSSEVIIFASGVSNSLGNEYSHFNREKELLEETIEKHSDCVLVYFGTCSVSDPELSHCPYVEHKINMENIIQKNCKHYYIFRLSQVVGKTNSPTLVNFLVNKIETRSLFSIWGHSTRNLIDVDDVFKIVDYFIQNKIFTNQITNIAAPLSLSILDIVAIIEELSGHKGFYEIEDRGGHYDIDINKISSYLNEIGITFYEKYPFSIIKKYFFEKQN
jgi:nucleoside-diphosphate-sugar epimerase